MEGQAFFLKKCDSEETSSLVQKRTMMLLNGCGNLWAALMSGGGGGGVSLAPPVNLPYTCPGD